MAQGSRGPELTIRGQQLLWTRETGVKQGSRAALGRVTRAKHNLVIARQVQGRMSLHDSRSGSAGPWPGTGVAAMQQEL